MAAAGILGPLTTIVGQVVGASGLLGGTSGPYRPSLWGQILMTSLTVPAQSNTSMTQDSSNGTIQVTHAESTSQVFVFDGYESADHNLKAVKTRKPTQTGSAITDHVYLEPRTVSLVIRMDESMDSYMPGQWSGAGTKSVNAFLALKSMWQNRTGLTVTTRLDTYQNMIITDLHTVDDANSTFGLRAVVTLEEIVFAQISSQQLSQREQVTGSTNQGELSSSAPAPVSVSQHAAVPGNSRVPGAGMYSSNNVTGS